MKPIHRLSIFNIFVSLSLPLAAQSTWNGTSSANWSNAANWSPGIAAENDNIIISNTTSNGLTLDDGSHSIGSITFGTTGTRTSGFTFQTTTANTLTIAGGFSAIGNFTGGIGPRLRGNYVLSVEQSWQIGGEAGSHAADRGVAFNEVSSGNPGSLTLNANLNKNGTGQLTFGATSVSGPGDININEGSLKLNAGGSLPLTVAGNGRIVANNSATLILSQNSGTFDISRPIQFNNTAGLVTGSGSNGKTGTFEIASDMEWTGIHTITNNTNNDNTANVNYLFTGVMSGTGNITKTGASQLTLSGATSNTLSGQVTVAGGELRLEKTGAIAVPGNILVTGGTLRLVLSDQLADTSSINVTGGGIAHNAGRTQTLSSLNVNSGTIASLSGFDVTGTTTLAGGVHQVNSGQFFSTHALAISNNAALQFVGANVTGSSSVNIGTGGLTLDTGRVLFGNPGAEGSIEFNLAGNVVSTGTSLFSAPNFNAPRLIDLQAGSRSFAVNDGTLNIQTTVQNGTLVKSGTGTLILSTAGSSADFSFTEGPVLIATQVNAGNVSLSGGSLLMDIGGVNPAKITTTGGFTSTGGSIEISAINGVVVPGTMELVRYGGALTGVPVINIPTLLAASRMNPVLDYGTGTDSAITLTSTGNPLELVWHGATGGLWDTNTTANFNTGSQKFYALDSVTFDDTGVEAAIKLDSPVFPTSVAFNHGATVPAYTLSGTGGISGPTPVTKDGTGTTILAVDNNYTGTTGVYAGVLQVGNGGLTGSLGSGAVNVDFGATLGFARDGSAVVGNAISGSGTIRNSGPGTVSFTANNTGFTGDLVITGGTLQFGDGGADGSFGTAPISIAAGATLSIKRSGVPTIPNSLSGDGSLTISGGSPILNGSSSHTGGITVTDGASIRMTEDWVLGAAPLVPTPNAVRLIQGGLKNQDTDPVIDINRGITVTGEAYFTAGWTKTLTINGPITGTGNVFINYDSGRILFNNPTSDWQGVLTLGANKPGFTGTTGGNLEINTITNGGVAGSLGKASADPGNLVFNGGRLIYNGESSSSNRGFTLQGAGTVDVVYSTLTLSGLATGPGSLTKAGVGTLVLTGANDFAGDKIVAGGTLIIKSSTALGDAASTVRFNTPAASPGTLELATDTSVAPYPVTIGVGNSGTILSGVGTPGPGINHTLGDFSLSTVTLNVGSSADVSGGDPRVTISSLNQSGGSAGTTTLNPTTADITLGSASIGAGNYAKTLSLGGTSQNNRVSGTIADGINILSLRKDNDSLWTVSGDNTFTGNVTVDDGVLAITHNNALGDKAKTLIIAGDAGNNRIPELRVSGGISPTVASLQISGAGVANLSGALRNIAGDNTLNVTTQVTMRTGNGNTTLYSDEGTLTINTPLVTSNTAGRTLTLSGPGNGVINGVIANGSTANLPVTKTGSGTWTLNGAHTYNGATTVTEGVLSLGQAALADDAAVTIAAGATLNLNFSGIDRVASLTIDGVVKPDGVYSAATDTGFITGNGSIRVGPEPQGFASWTSSFPFSVGVNDGPNDDPDADGISNLLEYVFGGVPVGAGASDTSILPRQDLTATDLVLTFRRSDSSEADVTLKVQWSDDLKKWNDFATIGPVDALPAVDVTEDFPTTDLDTVVVTIPRNTAPGGKLFARVQAVK
jgi:autotransporter-associated beta strand protein